MMGKFLEWLIGLRSYKIFISPLHYRTFPEISDINFVSKN